MRKFEKESNIMMKRKKDEKLKMMKNSDDYVDMKDEDREKVEAKGMKETSEKTVSISKNTLGTLGESWKGKNWVTPTPSSVKTFRKSAAKDARGGQLL